MHMRTDPGDEQRPDDEQRPREHGRHWAHTLRQTLARTPREPAAARAARLPFARAPQAQAPRSAESREAEARTEAVLRGLPGAHWTIISSYHPGHGDSEHVVVGDAGVFLVLSRKPLGCVRVQDGVVWLRHGGTAQADRPGVAINRRVIDPARSLQREIRARTGANHWVSPVVVLWSEFPQRVAETRQLAFVHGRDLSTWMRSRPVALSAADQAAVVVAVEDLMREGARRILRLPRHSAA